MIFLGPFPKGNVSTLRIISYCKELVEQGHYVCVYLLAPTKESGVNTERKGQFNGIDFIYVSKVTWRRNNVSTLIKGGYYMYGVFAALFLLSKNKTDCILTYYFSPISNLVFGLYAKIRRIEFILDKTEYPKNFFNASSLKRKFIECNLRAFDKIITISHELKSFYGRIVGNKNVFLLPMSIDPQRYSDIIPYNNLHPYIAVVFGTHNRDNILDSIKSYIEFSSYKQNRKVELFLIGNYQKLIANHPSLSEMDCLIKNTPNIKVMGMIDNALIPSFLKGASCLLSTPVKYISGGFPTKLGEYLLSGKPVVITNVGEIPFYLKDNETAFLCNPGDITGIAKRIDDVFENYNRAKIVGDNGRNLALTVFNAKTYINELIDFIN